MVGAAKNILSKQKLESVIDLTGNTIEQHINTQLP